MSDFTEELGIIVRLDGTVELSNGMKLSGQQISEVGKQLDEYGKKLQQTDKGHKAVTTSTKEVGQATAQTARDVAGLTREIAQGDWRGAATKMGEMATQSAGLSAAMRLALNPLTLLAVAAGTLGYAAYKGAEEERKLNDQLILTGNFAGLVGGQIDSMATKVASGIGGTVGKSSEVLAGLVGTGRFTKDSLEEVAGAVQLFARFSGQSEEQALKMFVGMSNGAAKWAAEMNNSYHFLTIEQFRHIRLLEEQGQKQEAMRLASQAFSEHVGGDLTKNMGYLDQALQGVEKAASAAWVALKNIGKEESLSDAVMSKRAQLAQHVERLETLNLKPGKVTADLRQELSALESDLRQGRRMAESVSDRKVDDARQINDELKPPKARTGKTAEQLLIERMEAYAEDLAFNQENAIDLVNMSPERRQYMNTLRRLETDFEKGPKGLLDKMKGTAYQTMEQQQAYREALERAKSGNREFDELSYGPDDTDRTQLHTGHFNRMDRAKTGNVGAQVNEDILQRQTDASQAGREMEAETKRLNLALVRDDQARVRAQFQLEADGWRQRIEKTREGTLERQTLEDQYARWMVARQEQLNEDLKPGWQKMIDGWGDANKMMRDAHDRTMQGVVQSGEDAFVEWSRTGKLNARSLVDGVIAEFARLQYRKFIAKPLAGFLEGALGSLFGGGGFGTGDDFGNEDIGVFLHKGGVVGTEATFHRPVNPSVWQGAPRYHGGGLVTGEVPIIAKKGEGVFTEQQMAALQPAGSGGTTVNYSPTIQIDARTDRAEVTNLVSQAMRASQAELLDKLDRRTA